MLKKTIIHCLLLILSYSAAYSQKLVFGNLGVKQGLPAMEVYNLYQDTKGYVWVFTEYGIVKHNGSKFVPVCRNLPLKESAIYATATSKAGELYIANSKAHIYKIRNDEAIRVKGIEKYSQKIYKSGSPILNLFLDDKDRLRFSLFDRTYSIPKEHYRTEGKDRVQEHSKAVKHRIYPLFPVRKLRKGSPKFQSVSVSLTNRFGKTVQSISRDSIFMSRVIGAEVDGNQYASALNELVLYRKNGEIKRRRFANWIIGFRIADNGHVWVGLSTGGLIELDARLNVLEHYLGNVTVSDILFDDQSGMWVSTIGDGLYYCRNTNYRSFYDVPALNSQITSLNSIGGKLFIGTAQGTLFVRDQGGLREIELRSNTACVNDVVEFESQYYVGTKDRTYILDRDFKVKEACLNNSYAFCKTEDGSLLTATGSTIWKWERKNKSFRLIRQNPWNRCLIERFPGEFFSILPDGIYRFNSLFSRKYRLRGLNEENISRIKIDSRKNIWICTKGNGLYQLTPTNKLLHYPNLPSAIINDVSFLSEEVMLLATNKGAFVNRTDRLQNPLFWKQLLDEEVLSILPFDQEIFIGTTSGLTSLRTDRLFGKSNYRFHLASVETEKSTIPLNRLSALNYRQNELYFNYDLLSYNEPLKQLNYKLTGPTALQGDVEGTQVHFQNLSPGEYTLYVYPKMSFLYQNDQKVLISSFYIRPAFWQTTYFLVFVIITGFALTSLVSWWIMRSRRKKEMERIHIEKLLAEYRLTALKAQVNPHFMSNSLVAIQELIIRKDTFKASQYLAKFSTLIRSLLNYSDQSVISLYNELKIIDLYVDLEQLRFSNRFIFQKEIDEDIQLDQLFIPALITQPLIENAIWHGLLPLSDTRVPTLIFSITMDKDRVCICIKDNGVGRKETNPDVPKSGVFRESKGMKLISKRIENLNKLYAPAEGSLQFVDLKDEKGKPAGSIVQLCFSLEMINTLYHERNQKRHY